MSSLPTRRGGAILGFALAGLPGVALAVAAETLNHAFVDDPWSLWIVAVALPGLFGLILGWLVRARESEVNLYLVVAEALVILGLPLVYGPRTVPELELVVLGVDGATWDVADPLIEEGRLPHLGRLREQGATGTLRAHEPMFSPLLWTTLATGVPPEEHGIRGFKVRSDRCLAPRFFDIAAHEGLRVGIYKWLVTWPPHPVQGFMVPAWLAPSPETWPKDMSWVKELELSRRLERKSVIARRSTLQLAWEGFRHGLRWSTLRQAATWALRERLSRPDPDERALNGQLLRARMDRDAFVFAVQHQRPQVATFTTYATDALGHRFWREYEPEAFTDVPEERVRLYGDAIPSAYTQADQILGEILELLPEDGRLVVLSDHGFQATQDAAGGTPVAPRTDRLEALLPEVVGPVQVARTGTRVVVTLDGADPASQREALERWLAGLTRASTGQPFFRWSPVEDSPRSLALDILEGRATEADLREDTVGGEPLADWARPFEGHWGDHHPMGLIALWGPGVEAQRLEADALDVAPTLLAALDIPASRTMDGQALVWPELPRVRSWDRAIPLYPESTEPDAEPEVNEEMLQELGYLDASSP